MCGIAGYLASYTPDILCGMANLIAHRGPDDEGFFTDTDAGIGIAHRRLSIIDLSPAGHQPMADASGRYTISYNGEIYNYPELREELIGRGAAFRGRSDTEVILELYSRDGPASFERLNGIFALAIWDGRERSLLVARDGMGVKPLYYCDTPSGFIFASEMKALLALPDLDRTLDRVAALSYLTYLWTAGERTMLQAVKKLDPGTWLRVSRKRGRESGRFYSLPLPRPRSASDHDLILGTQRALQTAVERQLIADVEVGAFLSGGLDSSALVAMARAAGNKLQCFTIDYGDAGGGEIVADLPYAQQAASHLGVELNEIRVDRFGTDEFERLVYQLDEPEADPAALNTFHIAGLARQNGIKVLLSGTGGDDLFTGYRRHQAAALDPLWSGLPASVRRTIQRTARQLFGNTPALRRVTKLLETIHADGNERVVRLFEWLPAEDVSNLLAGSSSGSVAAVRAPLIEAIEPLSNLSAVERALRLDQRFFLPDHNLNYTDKAGMAAGVEIRVPFLDPDLVAWAASLPPRAKMRRGQTKWILRKAMEPYLPRQIIYRPKSGFGLPLRAMLGTSLRPMMEQLLDSRAVASRSLFDPDGVERLKSATLQGSIDGSYTLLALMAVELWLRRFVDPMPKVSAA
ncbi:MAG: asparagine synthase (glutamine-hydrolyzing) [Sphingosinicella sp.]|uniref:asparagine synthase (glutamine-hydrolyzing) n=1 Tax=Sphingosinicella sp. TaxID=1917971 RepID=UPI00403833B1